MFGEHERWVRVARGVAEGNSSFLSAIQTSQVTLFKTVAKKKKTVRNTKNRSIRITIKPVIYSEVNSHKYSNITKNVCGLNYNDLRCPLARRLNKTTICPWSTISSPLIIGFPWWNCRVFLNSFVSKKCVFPLRKLNWRLKINSFATRALLVLRYPFFRFFREFKTSISKKKKAPDLLPQLVRLLPSVVKLFAEFFPRVLNAKCWSHSRNFFFSRHLLATSSACTIGIWSTSAQLNLITRIY